MAATTGKNLSKKTDESSIPGLIVGLCVAVLGSTFAGMLFWFFRKNRRQKVGIMKQPPEQTETPVGEPAGGTSGGLGIPPPDLAEY